MADVTTADEWLVIAVEVPSDEMKDLLAEGLLALGGSAVEERGATLMTYVRPPEDVAAWLTAARAELCAAAGADALEITCRRQPGEDWSETWKRGLKPRRVGRRFVVAPTWATPDLRADDLVIVIDPEMAFGTGEHATTRAALRFLESIVQPGDRVLDVGTGSAILAIGAAMLGAGAVDAVDNDPDAILNARHNVDRNGVAGIVRLKEQAVDPSYLRAPGTGRYDIIAANVLSSVLEPLLLPFFDALRPGSHLILGGILEEEADDMLAAGSAAGFGVIAEDLEEEWWAVLLQRPQPAER